MGFFNSNKTNNNSRKITILIVDDHQLIIDGVKTFLKSDTNITVKGQAYHGQEALYFLDKEKVDIVLLDLNMPVMDGVTTAKAILEKYPKVKIIILSMFGDVDLIFKSIRCGVQNFVSKNRSKEDILRAIYTVFNDGLFVSEDVIKMVFQDVKNSHHSKLTTREIEVLRLIAKGLTSKEIAVKLYISLSTVNSHRRNLIEKTGVLNSQALVKYAIENDLI